MVITEKLKMTFEKAGNDFGFVKTEAEFCRLFQPFQAVILQQVANTLKYHFDFVDSQVFT